ncbi:MAG TPA: TSUP family transporter [Actinomycetota bacterium]
MRTGRRAWSIPLIGMAGGLISGLLGVGGGLVIVPGLVFVARMAQRRAHATSLAAIVPVAAVGAVVYAATERAVDLRIAAVLTAGAIVGAPLGVRALARIPEPALRVAFAALSMALGIRLVLT